MTKPKLPKGWSDFKIVETVNGSFTGQVWIKEGVIFGEKDRIKLRKITKKYLETLIGERIVPLNKK